MRLQPNAFYGVTLLFVFYMGTATFLILGFAAILGAYFAMKIQFEMIKERQKEVKETSVNPSAYISVHGEAEVKEKKNS
jgi:hypothetical protein